MIGRQHQERKGEAQARERAGLWPIAGSLDDYLAARDRAVRAACRVGDIAYRWNVRFRLWERPDDPVVDLHSARLEARKTVAVTIAEDREWMLRRLCAAPVGRA